MSIIAVIYVFYVVIYRVLGTSREIRLRKINMKYTDSHIIYEQNMTSRSRCAALCMDHHCTGSVHTQLGPAAISCQLFRDYPMKSATLQPTPNVYTTGKLLYTTFTSNA